ncbi:hypothetical protein KORDIASMS9_04380 [Kordia sp. SMS9]|uniref:hypothetical protein n=1 Tax=Kordia sp. SMS9 TaxID=2282170 RepID=UPI000E0D771D|nr:hypothetical protein [Kordia sp. SMS9]AXG72117.1 hypothetical protein KORDIASMS9_04380 [Kordia sp. SMS9]
MKIKLYAGGENLSLRELGMLSSIIESAIFLGGLNMLRKNAEADPLIKEKLDQIMFSFKKFIIEKSDIKIEEVIYDSKIFDYERKDGLVERFVQEYFGIDYFYSDNYRFRNSFLKEKEIQLNEYLRAKKHASSQFNMNTRYFEFYEWLIQEYNNSLLEIEWIRSTNSIESLIDVSSILAIFLMQEMPVAKDLLEYGLGIISHWHSKAKGNDDQKLVESEVPNLPKSFVKLLKDYDEVNLKIEKDKFELKLKRKK